MKRTVVLAASLCVLAGCHKQSASTDNAPPPTVSTQAVNSPQQPPGPPPPQPLTDIPAPTTPNSAPDLNLLTMRLRDWIYANGRTPKNFEDFAATAHMQIPPPPSGKKYAISARMRVILVDR